MNHPQYIEYLKELNSTALERICYLEQHLTLKLTMEPNKRYGLMARTARRLALENEELRKEIERLKQDSFEREMEYIVKQKRTPTTSTLILVRGASGNATSSSTDRTTVQETPGKD